MAKQAFKVASSKFSDGAVAAGSASLALAQDDLEPERVPIHADGQARDAALARPGLIPDVRQPAAGRLVPRAIIAALPARVGAQLAAIIPIDAPNRVARQGASHGAPAAVWIGAMSAEA